MASPKRAVIENCKYCLNNQRANPANDCQNTICYWWPIVTGKGKVKVEQIKEWCLKQCVGGDRKEYHLCTGVLLKGGICPLHPFKDGHNPNCAGRTPKHLPGTSKSS